MEYASSYCKTEKKMHIVYYLHNVSLKWNDVDYLFVWFFFAI